MGFRRKTFKCPDGSSRTVYRNIDRAFPLYIKGHAFSLAGKARAPDASLVEAVGHHKSEIQGLLFGLDEWNKGIMLSFRAAYVSYAGDPCGNGGAFDRQVDRLIRETERLNDCRMKVAALVMLAQAPSVDQKRILDTFQRIADQLPDAAPVAAALEIDEGVEEADEWINR